MCFEQAGPWQQKSCAMLKQWQRYGAGNIKLRVLYDRLAQIIHPDKNEV